MKKLCFLMIMSTILIAACKDSDRDTDTSINSSTDYAMAQSYVYDVFKMVHEAALSSKDITTNNLSDTTTLFGCDTLIVDTMSSPMSITIQFNGTCSNNSNSRSGSIVATFSNKYDNFGTAVNISFNNYIYNNYPINGNISYTYGGVISGVPTYNFSINQFSIKNSKELSVTFSGNQSLGIISGKTTAEFNDDTYSISGTASGRAYAGNEFNATINTNLSLLGSCKWVSSGITSVSPENKVPRNLDFGSGCDNKATAKIYTISHEIVIP